MIKDIPVLSVSQINDYVKSLLDNSTFLKKVCVRGEISNFTNHYKTGHFYFTLKDEGALLKAVMFQSYASKIRFMPENSMQVLVTGRISAFPRDGVYQLYAESMEPLGMGALYAAFEQMKAKLEAAGYFNAEHKKPLPRYPKKIGIVTSPIGAAVADMKNIISRRYPFVNICIYPAQVQGDGAVEDLVEGIRYFDADKDTDVIIIGRGGGSLEDLWCFNNEYLAKVIYACKTPIISAVGHEVDFTISDFVADLRAPTPSAAAELAVPDRSELLNILAGYDMRLTGSLSALISDKKAKLGTLSDKQCFRSAQYFTDRLNEDLADYDRRLSLAISQKMTSCKQAVSSVSAHLAALNPMNILARGYAAVFDQDGKVVSSYRQVTEKDTVSLRFADGTVRASVLSKHAYDEVDKDLQS